MTAFSIEGAKKERSRLLAEAAKIRQKIKVFDDFINGLEASDAIPTNGHTQDSTKARVKILIPELIHQNGGKATKDEIKKHLKEQGIKIEEGTLNVYMSKDDNIEYDAEAKAWVTK